MSVLGLSSTVCNIYGVINTLDIYASDVPNYYLKYANVPIRTRYLNGRESIISGKEQNLPIYRIYIPYQLNIDESDIIVDQQREVKYDILNVNLLNERAHIQLDVKLSSTIMGIIVFPSSSSSSSSYINNWSSSSSNSSSKSTNSSSSESSK